MSECGSRRFLNGVAAARGERPPHEAEGEGYRDRQVLEEGVNGRGGCAKAVPNLAAPPPQGVGSPARSCTTIAHEKRPPYHRSPTITHHGAGPRNTGGPPHEEEGEPEREGKASR